MEARPNATMAASLYPLETLLKALFVLMSLFNMGFTLTVAFFASLIGVLRVCKTPQFSTEYLTRVLSNNHGQNILYIALGGIGYVNYLYYAPIALFFAYGIVEFVKIKYPQNGLNVYGDMIRNSKYAVFEAKAKLEIAFFVFLLVTLPFDLGGRLVKLFLIGQFLLVKYKVNPEFRGNCTTINVWIEQKVSGIQFLSQNYRKVAGMIHGYASKDIQGQ